MKKSLFFSSMVILLLGACSASQIKPAPALLPETKRIIVVPVGVSAPAGRQIDGWVMFGSALPPEEEGGPALISDALSLFARELQHEKLSAMERAPSEPSRKTWNPALTLAQEAATLIASASPYEVFVRGESHTIPASDRSDRHSLLQDWYQRNTPALNLEEFGEVTNTRVLELGLSDCALLDDQLVLQLLLKIVDPSTGQVMARTWNQALIDIGSPEQLFTHGGVKFKTVVVAEGRRLLERNLRDLGLLPGRDAMIQ